MAGEYHSVFKGRGMDFDEVREYSPGDEVRLIDWNVTARTGLPLIKKLREERELTILLAVDVSASGKFGLDSAEQARAGRRSRQRLSPSPPSATATRSACCFSPTRSSTTSRRQGPPARAAPYSRSACPTAASRGTNLTSALQHINRALSRRAVIFLISDFMDERFDRALKITGQHHDLIAVPVVDASELALPNIGWITFEDAETGEVIEIDTGGCGRALGVRACGRRTGRTAPALLRQSGLDTIEVQTDRPYFHALMAFFASRYRRLNPA